MLKIKSISVAKSTIEQFHIVDKLIPESEITRKLEAMNLVHNGETDAMICVDANGCESTSNDGTPTVFEAIFNRKVPSIGQYIPLFAGSSAIRKAQSMWFHRDHYKAMIEWMSCGLNVKTMKIAANKLLAYFGLLSSNSKTLVEAFGDTIDVRKIAVINDFTNIVHGEFDCIDKNDCISREIAPYDFKFTDGYALLIKPISKGECFTLRGPWIKAMCDTATLSNFADVARAHNIKIKDVYITDVFGNKRKLTDLDAIMHESCFKATRQYIDAFGADGWNKYCDAFEALGHNLCVCVREHAHSYADLSYQPLQTLVSLIPKETDDNTNVFTQFHNGDLKSLFDKYVDGLKRYETNEGLSELLGRNALAKAACLYPQLFGEWYTLASLEKTYTSRRNRIAGGRIPRVGHTLFIAPDKIAVISSILFGKFVRGTGSLNADEVCVRCYPEGEIGFVRYPHFDHAHVVRKNVHRASKFMSKNTLYISVYDWACLQVQGDFDGDHVLCYNDDTLIKAAKDSASLLYSVSLLYAADSAKKVVIGNDLKPVFDVIRRNTAGAPIGLYANAITRLWAKLGESNHRGCDFDLIKLFTKDANTKIDAAKHSDGGTSEQSKTSDAQERVRELNKSPFPAFMAFAKRPSNPEGWVNELNAKGDLVRHVEITSGVCDTWMRYVTYTTDEPSVFVDKIAAEYGGTFDWRMLVRPKNINMRNVVGFCKVGHGKDFMQDEGVFNAIARRKAQEWKTLAADGNDVVKKAIHEKDFKKAALSEIEAFIVKYNEARVLEANYTPITLDDVADYVVRSVYHFQNAGRNEQLYRTLWSVFGDIIVEHLKENLETTGANVEDINDEDQFTLNDFDEE